MKTLLIAFVLIVSSCSVPAQQVADPNFDARVAHPAYARNGPQVLFDEALEIATPAERAAYLDRQCAGAPELRRRVEALLKAHADADAGGFLENSVLEDGPTQRLYLQGDEI